MTWLRLGVQQVSRLTCRKSWGTRWCTPITAKTPLASVCGLVGGTRREYRTRLILGGGGDEDRATLVTVISLIHSSFTKWIFYHLAMKTCGTLQTTDPMWELCPSITRILLSVSSKKPIRVKGRAIPWCSPRKKAARKPVAAFYSDPWP